MEIRRNVIWSNNPNDLSVQVISPSNFKIFTVSFFTIMIDHLVEGSWKYREKDNKHIRNRCFVHLMIESFVVAAQESYVV